MVINATENTNTLNTIYDALRCNMNASNDIAKVTAEIQTGEASGMSYCWIIPANIVLAGVSLLLSPLFIIANLIMGAVFKLTAFCASCVNEDAAKELDEVADKFLQSTLEQVTDIPLTLIVRIFNPAAPKVECSSDPFACCRDIADCVDKEVCCD